MITKWWRVTWWALFFTWLLCAIFDVFHVHAGLLTSYGADFTLPAWLYISARSLDDPRRQTALHRFCGRTPQIAAGVFFLASAATEISQYFWPKGIFPGTFDPFDILAYASGIGICYLMDRRAFLQGA